MRTRRGLASVVLLSAVSVLVAASAGAATNPRRVSNINPGAGTPNIESLTRVGDTLYFTADDGTRGVELWKTKGTLASTKLVKDIRPGGGSFPSDLVSFDGQLFFEAFDGDSSDLWRTDGTTTGTKRVKSGVSPEHLTRIGKTLYFSGFNANTGRELWKSNGTSATTSMIKDLAPGTSGSGPFSSSPEGFTKAGDNVFFAATNPSVSTELFRTRGTAATTQLVMDINPDNGNPEDGPEYSEPEELTNVNGTLFFSAFTDAHGRELWKSNGIALGTDEVADIRAGEFGSVPTELTAFDGKVFFSADEGSDGAQRARELWKSGGNGATLVKDIDPGEGFSDSDPEFLTVVGTKLFFAADDGENGTELWKTSGTQDGTVMVANISPGAGGSYPENLTNVGGKLYFQAGEDSNGYELWRSGGTSATTDRVTNINPGAGSSSPSMLTRLGDALYFPADDGAVGRELWRYDLP